MKRVVKTIFALTLVAALTVAVGVGSSGFTNWNVKAWFNGWGKGSDQPPTDQQGSTSGGGGGAVISDVEENGVQILSARLPVSAFAANGISEAAESAYQLTATISPSSATNVTLEWSVDWSDPSNAWIADKSISDYATVTPSADDPKVAAVECLQPFGAQINITVNGSAPDCETKSATCTMDYLQRVESLSVSFGDDVHCNFDSGKTNVIVQLNPKGKSQGGILKETLIKSDVYSQEDDFTVSYKLTPCNPILYAMNQSGASSIDQFNNNSKITNVMTYIFGDTESGKITSLLRDEMMPTVLLGKIDSKIDHSTLENYSVNRGIEFGMKFFLDELGLRLYEGEPSTTINQYNFSTNGSGGREFTELFINKCSKICENIKKAGDGGVLLDGTIFASFNKYATAYGGLDLFNLDVSVQGARSSFEKRTTFRIGGYCVALDSITLDNSVIIV